MKLDTGLAVVILAVLVFYLRLIIIQRQRAKQVKLNQEKESARNRQKKGKQPSAPANPYSVLSPRKIDRIIGIAGGILILFGVLLYADILSLPTLQTYWWIPTALGIVGFSWLFQLAQR